MQNVWYSLYTAEELKGNAWVSVSYGGREDDQRISQICVKCVSKYIILLMLSDKYWNHIFLKKGHIFIIEGQSVCLKDREERIANE